MALTGVLYLPWINPVEILEKYKRGEYSNITLNSIKCKLKADTKPVKSEKYGTNFKESRFQFRVNNGGEIAIITRGADVSGKEVRCKGCNHVLDDDQLIKEGVVIKRQNVQEINANKQITVIKEFITVDAVCDLNCALMVITRNRSKYPPSAEQDTRFLHKCIYPDSGPLIEALDPGLLDINGGTYTYEEYKQGRNERHRDVAGLRITPSRTCYVRI